MAIANVTLTDTFDQWRIKTNQLIIALNQNNGFVTNTANDLANSVNVSIASVKDSGNNANIYGMAYTNSMSNTINIAYRSYANSIGNTSNVFVMSYANSSFLTISNGAVVFAHANAAFDKANSSSEAYAFANGTANSANAYTIVVGAASNTWANNVSAVAFLAANNASNTAVGAFTKANTSVQNNTTTKITVGYTIESFNAGSNIAAYGTWTPNAANGNYQFANSNGAITIASPANDCAIDVLWTNGINAKTVTFSGYTAPSEGGGDTYVTTNANRFLLMIRRINSISTYVWKALQ